MMNRAINNLVLATVDSLKIFKNKLAYYLAIFAMVFGSTFGTFNAANAATYTIGDGLSSAVAEILDDQADDASGTTLAADSAAAIIMDGDSKIDSAVDVTAATLSILGAETTNVLTLEFANKTMTITGAITTTDSDTGSVSLTESGANLVLSGSGVVGNEEDHLFFIAAANTTITLSGDHTYSANFDGAGTLKVTGDVTLDEAIGSGTDMGVLDVDGTITITDTINPDILDLDGTIAGGAGSTLIVDSTNALGGSITTAGVTTLTGATTLTGNSSVTTTNAIVKFGGAVNGTDIDLTINSGTAATNFDGIVGGSAGVGAIALTGALDLDAAITDAESISVSLASNLGASITTTGTTGTTITLSDAATLSAATTLTTANTDISLEEVAGAAALTLVAGTGNITTSAAMTQVTTMTVTSATTASFAAVTNATSTVLNSTGANTFNGILTSPIVDINAGTSTFSGVVTASTRVDVAGADTIVNIDAAPDTAQLLLTAGTVNIGVKDVDIDDLDMNGGTIVVEKTVLAGDSVFLVSGQTTAGVGSTGAIIMPVNLANGGAITLFNDAGTIDTTAASVDLVLTDTALTDYQASLAGGDLLVTSVDKSQSAIATELGITSNAATALLQARNSVINDTVVDGTAEDAFYNVLNAQGGFTTADGTALAKQVEPQTDTISGSAVATRAMTGTVQGIVSNRMASLRSGDAYVTGMSAGNGMSAKSGFIQAFGSEAEQENTGPATATVYGYDSQTSGVAIGFDGMTDNGSTIGFSASYSSTDVDGNGTGKSKNAIDSYTVSLYADKASENGYIEGSLTYGINENTSSRLVNTAGLSRSYKGNYDSDSISLKVGGGVVNEVNDGTFVTPFISATATTFTTDTYTETSTTASDALRLKIEQDDINSLVGTVGIKAHQVTDSGTPMISFAINNEFGDTLINSTNTYQGGGTAFTTSTEVEELSATLGLGYSFGNDVSSLNFNYEANANRNDYLSHYGTVKIVSKF